MHSFAALIFFGLAGLTLIALRGQGRIFSIINTLLRDSFGISTLFFPFLFFAAGLQLTRLRWAFAKPHVLLGGIVLFFGTMTLFSTGSVGILFFESIASIASVPGATLILTLVIIAGVLLLINMSVGEVIHSIASIFELIPAPEGEQGSVGQSRLQFPSFSKKTAEPEVVEEEKPQTVHNWNAQKIHVLDTHEKPSEELPSAPAEKKKVLDPEKKIDVLGKAIPSVVKESGNTPAAQEPLRVWTLPPIALLDPKTGGQANRGDVNKNADKIEETLRAFGVEAQIADVRRGPAVTQYCLAITQGTKLSKITTLANDLALALAAPTGQIRIEAPIPGTSWVGIEIPNLSAEFVTLRTMLLAEEMKKRSSKLAVALGLDVSGKPVVVDIAKMPHALIAGATGSGKSVAINAFIASILFRASPDEVKFIMVDPKRVELTQYNGIPHLITPVVTETSKVLGTLTWAVAQMNERYKLFAQVGVRNIEAYNEMAGFQAMHYIVIVIDELADIMLLAPAPVEEAITRLAQMARAVGIHLLLATQRPSVNVITGLIKANVPTRIAFNVSSMIDSRVILDSPGAEKLLGKGDMLYIPPDQAKPTRVQGTYVADHEIRKLIEFIKSQGVEPSYVEEIAEKYQTSSLVSESGKQSGTGDKDEGLMVDAIRVILQYNRASVSVLQRRLSIGYGRAARIVDALAEEGIVGEDQGSKGREVFVTKANEYLSTHGSTV